MKIVRGNGRLGSGMEIAGKEGSLLAFCYCFSCFHLLFSFFKYILLFFASKEPYVLFTLLSSCKPLETVFSALSFLLQPFGYSLSFL